MCGKPYKVVGKTENLQLIRAFWYDGRNWSAWSFHAPHEVPTGRSAGFQTGLSLTQEMGADVECGRHKPVWKPALRPFDCEISRLVGREWSSPQSLPSKSRRRNPEQLESRDSLTNSVADQFGCARTTNLFHQSRPIRLNGVAAQAEFRRHFLVSQPLRNQPQ